MATSRSKSAEETLEPELLSEDDDEPGEVLAPPAYAGTRTPPLPIPATGGSRAGENGITEHDPSGSGNGSGTVTTGADAGGGGDGGEGSAEEDALDAKRMTLLEHLNELRMRLRNAAIFFFVSMVVSFFFVQRFFELLTRPVRSGMIRAGFDHTLNVKGVTEPFWVYMKLAIIAGLIIASPFVVWELWKFIAPGLYKKEKRVAGLVSGATALCFIGGAFFGYAILCEPAAYYMMGLLKVEGHTGPVPFETKPLLMMEDVANFLMLMLAGCGAAFELPVVVALLGWMGVITTRGLWKFNKYALVLATVLGAVLTPSADPFTQLLLAGPLFLLYQFSIGVVWLIERARKRKEKELEDQYGDGSGSSGGDGSSG
jgi:sec-independent protein translocase protein TatC